MLFSSYFLIISCLILSSFQALGKNKIENNTPLVITTVPYLADLVSQVTCQSKEFRVETIIAAGTDPHTFSLTPALRLRIAAANLLILVGAGLEPWLLNIGGSKSANAGVQTAQRLTATDGLKLDPLRAEADGHSMGFDPHIWQSPSLTLQAAQNVANALKSLRPDLSVRIDKCLLEFNSAVEKERVELKAKVLKIPEKSRIIATNHDSMGYFAKELNFEVISIVGVSTEAAPTPKQLSQTVMKLRKSGVKALFLETTASKKAIDSMAREVGARLGGSLFSDGLGEPGSGAETILLMWKKNAEILLAALKD